MWSQARANVLEPERPALRIKTFTDQKYIVSLPLFRVNQDGLHVERPHDDSPDPEGGESCAGPARAPVWLGKIEPVELGARLHNRAREDHEDRGRQDAQRNPEARRRPQNGVLARHRDRPFRILSDADLKKAATSPPGEAEASRGVTGAPLTERRAREADEALLVSTQILGKS